MLIYILRRVGLGLTVMLATLISTFLLFFAGPIDPAQAMCPETKCPDSKLAIIRENLGLDRPFLVQFKEYFTGLFVGRDYKLSGDTVHCSAPCLGMSFKTNQPVGEAIFSRFPATVLLTIGVMIVALIVGVGLGIIAAGKRGRPTDRIVIGASQVFGAIPYYVLALLFMLYTTRLYPIFPQSVSMSEGIGRFAMGIIAPCIILGLVTATTYARYSRNSMIETSAMDYVRTARSKGISERAVTFNHSLRAALSPIITLLGMDIAALLSGTLITERIFQIDGIGNYALTSLFGGDLPVIMGTVLLTAFFVVTMNIIVDVVYSLIDPRVRLS